MSMSRPRLLVVYAQYTSQLSYFDDWLDAFRSHRDIAVSEFNIAVAGDQVRLRNKLGACDGVVLLHSTNGDTTAYLDPYAPVLAERKVPLLSFVGNEVNLPGSPISEKRDSFEIIRPDWIATQLLQEAGDYLFGDVVRRGVVSIPHALNPAVFQARRAQLDRPIDLGARLSRYLPHLGDDDRNRVADFFRQEGPKAGLVVDISEARFDREGWVSFLNDCKGTVSSESGSWFLERDDRTVSEIRRYVLEKAGGFVIANDSPLRTLGHKLPPWLKALMRRVLGSGPLRHESLVNEHASFDEIYQKFFANRPRPAIYGKCISSRHFDAIGTKTCQIMLRGRYNDILMADDHYLALEEDFSNISDVVERFRDGSERYRVIVQAYDHVMEAHTYSHRVGQVTETLLN